MTLHAEVRSQQIVPHVSLGPSIRRHQTFYSRSSESVSKTRFSRLSFSVMRA